jgi:DNA-binding beta-propeller fold protein YncE
MTAALHCKQNGFRKLSFFTAAMCLWCLAGFAQVSKPKAAPRELPLPSSKALSLPVPGGSQPTNSFPTALALSPDGKYLAILNNGYGTAESRFQQSIALLDLSNNRLRDFPDSRLGINAKQTYFLGLAWSTDGKELYASVASLTDPLGQRANSTGNGVAVYQLQKGALVADRFLKLPLAPLGRGRRFNYNPKSVDRDKSNPYPAGLAVVKSEAGDRLLIAENLADDVVLIDTRKGEVLQRFDLGRGKYTPIEFPYGVAVQRDGGRAWCSLWNGSEVAELDLRSGKVARHIGLLPPKRETDPSSHPTELLLSPDERQLYVTLSNRDSLAVISTEDGRVERYLKTSLPGQAYGGSYPNALAESKDGSQLYVANASSDAVAVFALGEGSESAKYFIPTEWYPTALAVRDHDLLIASGKGQGTGPNAGWEDRSADQRHPSHQSHPYIAALIRGSITRVDLAEAERNHERLTQEVLRSNRMEGRTGEVVFQQGSNPVRHVIYVLKENRTYDQVFGDIAEANGDRTLVMYGEDITPNQHQLARQFGILDNFYDSGEVSGDGHVWSTAAITSDYTEKTWQIVYRGKQRHYDFEGYVGDDTPLSLGVPDVDEPATGYLWGNLARQKLSYRHYGEFVNTYWCSDIAQNSPASTGKSTSERSECPQQEIKPGEELPQQMGGGKNPYQYAIPMMAYNVATKPELRDHYDPNYPDFKVEYPEQFRADEFLREFTGFVAARKSGTGEQLPNFVLLRLPDDHTAGTRRGSPTPNASVADNDLAVGRVVEAVSASLYWDDTAIFVVEDDAQNGADHVDAHRSIALVISKYSPGTTKQPAVEHHFYTTVNMIHTMEVLLGLPPMNNNDAYAPVMAPLFTGSGSQPAFKADYRNRDNGLIYQANTGKAYGAGKSARLDFSRADAADANALNAILWHEAKGNVPLPKPRHSVFPAASEDASDK